MNLYKPKPKLFKRLIALALAVVTAITALPITALAESMTFGGNSNSSVTYTYSDGFKYGFKGDYGQHVSWRISLYVSTSDTGEIDPTRDSIVGQNGLGYVGTILYDNFTSIGTDVYYQLMYTADTRNATLYNAPDGTVRTFPYMTKVDSGDKVLKHSDLAVITSNGGGPNDYTSTSFTPDGSPIYHNTTDLYTDYGLPYLASQCNGKVVENAVSTHEFAQQIIEDMNRHLGGSSAYFDPLYAKVVKAGLGSEVIEKLAESKAATGETDYSLLLPTNDDCVVEWCLVVEPISEYTTIYQPSFWDCALYDDFYTCWEQVFIGLGTQTTIGLDAYAVAQYNEKSKVAYTYNSILETIKRNIPDFQTTGVAAGDNKYYDKGGKLIAEYGTTNINNAASMNYDCHTGYSTYCGVNVAGASPSFSYSTNPAYAASYGGISVYTTDKDKSTIPVYYYIYDQENPDAPPRKEIQSYSQNDTHTFQPSTEYGIPIAMESTWRTDKCFDEFGEYVDFNSYRTAYGSTVL